MDRAHEQKPPIVWPTTLLLIITPLVALVGIPWYQITVGFEWQHWLAFVVIAALNGIAITAGYHRLWAHKTYTAAWPMRLVLALFGAAAFQHSILTWSSQHRRHHRHVDDNDKDPYSANKGLWFSHIGWMLRHYPNNENDFSNCKDLERDPIVRWQHKHYYTIAIAMNIAPPAILGFITGDWVAYFLTAGFLRLVYSHHTTFFINSLAHYWGRRPYTSENTARDNDILALFTYGEGYHNFHHLFQNDYRNGVRWWQFDPTKWLIRGCSWLGLAKDLRVTPKFKIRQAMVQRKLEEASERLNDASLIARIRRSTENVDYVQWRTTAEQFIEQEQRQLAQLLAEWSETRELWLAGKREQLAAASLSLKDRLDATALRHRLQLLDKAVKQQYQRVNTFNLALA